jgi:hypothetical protein
MTVSIDYGTGSCAVLPRPDENVARESDEGKGKAEEARRVSC